MEQPIIPQDQTQPRLPGEVKEESIFQESDYSLEEYDKHIRNARNMVFVVAALQLINIFFVNEEDELTRNITYGLIIFITLLFAGLALLTKKRPFTALIAALSLYGLLLILDVFFDPSSLAKGIFLKVAIISSLISGLRNAKAANDLKKAFGKA